jgi:hypothetical protein
MDKDIEKILAIMFIAGVIIIVVGGVYFLLKISGFI